MSEGSRFFLTLLTGASGAALVVAAVGLLGRSFVQGWLARDVAKYQADLALANTRELTAYKATLDEKLEAFKSHLQREADESRARYERVHDRLHLVLPDTYAALSALRDAVRSYALRDFDPTTGKEQERREKVDAAWRHAVNAFNLTVLYLPPKTLEKILIFIQVAIACGQSRAVATSYAEGEPEIQKTVREGQLKMARRLLENDVQPALESVWKEFRDLLGVLSEPGGAPESSPSWEPE